jgi:hypothetical protein
MRTCKVCGLLVRGASDTCSTACAVEAWAATWAVTLDERREASWCGRRRRAEARGEPFTESKPLDVVDRELFALLASNPNLKALWESFEQARAA